eukprot:4382067-Lingulodinium_polyedra.AAC.1
MVKTACFDPHDIEPHRVVKVTQSTLATRTPQSQPSHIILASWRPGLSQLAAHVLAQYPNAR